MSAPSYGYLQAHIYGLPFTFDGNTWTYPEIPEERQEFFSHALLDLNSSFSRRKIMHHMSLRTRARIILEYAVILDNGWEIVEEVPSKDWDEPLPSGAVD